jgi:hypothetical protein
MIGGRPDEPIHYPVSEIAAKYGASVAKDTDEPDERRLARRVRARAAAVAA